MDASQLSQTPSLDSNVARATQYFSDKAGEVITQTNAADAGGWYAGRFISTYGPDLAVSLAIKGGIAAVGGAALTGTAVGLLAVPIFAPILVPIAAKTSY